MWILYKGVSRTCHPTALTRLLCTDKMLILSTPPMGALQTGAIIARLISQNYMDTHQHARQIPRSPIVVAAKSPCHSIQALGRRETTRPLSLPSNPGSILRDACRIGRFTGFTRCYFWLGIYGYSYKLTWWMAVFYYMNVNADKDCLWYLLFRNSCGVWLSQCMLWRG